MKNFLILVFIWLIIPLAKAQNVEVTTSAPNVVELGEQFQLDINVNATPTDLQPPDMHDLKVLYGPTTSQSFSQQIINNKVSQSISNTFTYVLKATKVGKFTIGSAYVTVKGKQYHSDPFTIEVIAGGSKNSQTTANQDNNQDTNETETINEGDAFLRVNFDKKTLIKGDYTTVYIKLYSRNPNIVPPLKLDDFSPEGFYKLDLPPIKTNKLETEVVNGQKFYSVLLEKFILIPQKSGDITIPHLNGEITLQQRIKSRSNGIFDDFFGPAVQNVSVPVKSKAVTIKVQPLPPNKPESFSGAVGKFNINASLDKNSIKANDAVSLKINITGKGNIKLLEAPKISFPPDFDTYDPKITQNLSTADGGLSGTKTFDYLLIPRNQGDYKIPALTFSYFDIASGTYQTLKTGDFNIHVDKGLQTQAGNVVTGFAKEDVKILGKDIIFIKTTGLYSENALDNFFGSILFYLIYIISILAFIIIIWLRRRIIRQNANLAYVRNKRADKYATQRLKQANAYLKQNDNQKFYDELIKAIWGYLSDKMNIPLSDLSRENAVSILEDKGIDEENINLFVNLIDNCEFARYAPASSGNTMKEDYLKAVNLITKLQQRLR